MPENEQVNAAELIAQAQKTFAERNKTYGSSYLRHGRVMKELYPDGVKLETIDDFNRFGVINMLVSKMCRYATDPKKGHLDSIHDNGVYSFILEEIDTNAQRN